MRRVMWDDKKTDTGMQEEFGGVGWLHQFYTDPDGDPAIVIELPNGKIKWAHLGYFCNLRFVEPHKPEVHHLADDSLDDARDHEPRSLAEIDAEMERAAQASDDWHDCTDLDVRNSDSGCCNCPDKENCNDELPF